MNNKGKQPTEDERMDQMIIDPYADIPSPLEGKKQIGNSPFQHTSIPLNGRLITEIDGVHLDEGDFQVLKNMRYGELSPRSIAGMTKINSTSVIYNDTPKSGYLIGWYKFDEGSGLVAANSATGGSSGGGLLPNLVVTNGSGTFWTARAGFGSVSTYSPSGSTDWANATLASALTYGGTANGLATVGMFFRTSVTTGSRVLNLSESLGVPSVQIAPNNPDANDITINGGAGTPWVDETMSVDTWYFVFLDSNGYVCQILPNGTLTASATATGITSVQTINLICIGTGWPNNTDGLGGSFGDTIVYNFTTLTRTQWAVWYDELRSRYSMSARSGW